jgi:hypothetical protein
MAISRRGAKGWLVAVRLVRVDSDTTGTIPCTVGPGLTSESSMVTAQSDSNADRSRPSTRYGFERRAAGHDRCRTVKDRLGVKGSGVVPASTANGSSAGHPAYCPPGLASESQIKFDRSWVAEVVLTWPRPIHARVGTGSACRWCSTAGQRVLQALVACPLKRAAVWVRIPPGAPYVSPAKGRVVRRSSGSRRRPHFGSPDGHDGRCGAAATKREITVPEEGPEVVDVG